MTSTLDRLRKILLKTYKIDRNKLAMDFKLDELGVDSLGIGLLLFDAEDEFKIKFTSEPTSLTTIGDVVRYIDGVIATQARPPEP